MSDDTFSPLLRPTSPMIGVSSDALPRNVSSNSLPELEQLKFIDKINQQIAKNEPFFSFEYFPPKTGEGLNNLYIRFDRMAALGPLFIDVTWGAGGNRANKSNISIEIAANAQDLCCIDCNMHLICNTLSRDQILEILKECQSKGIRNILALRGDPPRYEPGSVNAPPEFNYASDLVKLIREEYGDYFGISVAGYPYLHPDCPSYDEGIQHLKLKVDAGADFVISQLFFTAEDFFNWEADCRAAGITCPIIPGILPIQGYDSLRNMTKMCAIEVPDNIKAEIEVIKDDDAKIKAYGIEYATKLCQELLTGGAVGLHFYTLNRELATEEILRRLKLVPESTNVSSSRQLPWKRPNTSKRRKEEVRPIFWANRQKSYLSRTQTWDEFPNGRWGDSRSPAFGELSDYHLFLHQRSLKPIDLKKMWGEEIKTPEDVSTAFIRFLNGEIDRLPWIDGALALETDSIKNRLVNINKAGFWTINSQPRANGVDSTDSSVGWGGPGGVVYQKAYIEFFTSPALCNILLAVLERHSPRYNFQAVNVKGYMYSNTKSTIAVTWGVFPGREIIQPTVVDPNAFLVWKDEAFALWMRAWANIYEAESSSFNTVTSIHDNYFLVNIVDNDFVKGDIFDIFDEVLEEVKKSSPSQ